MGFNNRLVSFLAMATAIILDSTTSAISWNSAPNSMHHAPNYIWEYPFYRLTRNTNQGNPTMKQDGYLRKIKAGAPTRMLMIDLSQLRPRQRSSVGPNALRLQSPVNLLGVDISVLSQNPDRNLPLVQSISYSGKGILGSDFNPQYDRLPILKPSRENNSAQRPKSVLLHPFQHLPLNVLTSYNSIMSNKKYEGSFNVREDANLRDEVSEKNTADFILHLLYQLSSKH